MPVEKLDHVNLRTRKLGEMIAWYSEVLGLEAGYRPEFSSVGAWLYADDAPVVHLVEVEEPVGAGSEVALKLEHFAFAATGRAEFEAKLLSMGEKFHSNELTAMGIVQYNVQDPDGNHIHVDFRTD